jgi:predicted nucleic acid-binding protein
VKIVVDASIAIEFLLQTTVGQHAASLLVPAALFAPELLDAEVLAVLRREALGGRLDTARAREAVEDLRDWDVERVPHRELVMQAWELRHNATAYDALYLATARLHDATLVTADGPLSRIPIAGFTIQNVSVR